MELAQCLLKHGADANACSVRLSRQGEKLFPLFVAFPQSEAGEPKPNALEAVQIMRLLISARADVNEAPAS